MIGPRVLIRSWRARVAVAGRSMEPAIADGDWLLVDPDAWQRRPPTPGALVLLGDPRAPERLLVKRVHAVLPDGTLDLRGDAPDRSTDSRHFGPVAPDALLGRPWLRVHPLGRAGRIR
ncbi:MAG: nickel-type superoxide dismutase maturation protease [Chloroflexota bacterium]